MKQILIIFLFFIHSLSFACSVCFATTQHKSFPVGVYEDKIVSVDFLIFRGSYKDKTEKKSEMPSFPKIKWYLKSYISYYDFDMKLLKKEEFEEKDVKKESYSAAIKLMFTKAFNTLKDKKIELFKTEYISFCNYQKNCERIDIVHDTINKKDFLVYKKKKFKIDLEQYKNYKDSVLFSENLSDYYISSVRVFKTDKIELFVAHLETGHEISMGFITNDPEEKAKAEHHRMILVKEEKPKFDFSDIQNSAYEEPLLHHAYGFDFMIINK